MTVDAGRRLLLLSVILWLGHRDCRALVPSSPTTDQHVQIVLLHRRGLDCDADSNRVGSNVSISASQRETAARWASEIINNQTKPHLFSIDVEVMDTCGSVQATAKRSLQVVRQIKSSGTAVLGVIALEEADVLAEAARVLRRHNIPLVVATPRAAESEAASLLLYAPDDPAVFTQPDNVFSAVPNTAAVARATIAVAKGIQSQSIRILGTCWRTIRMAERAARHLNIRVISAEHWVGDYSGSPTAYIANLTMHQHVLEQQEGVRVALLMEPNELADFMNQAVRISSGRKITWLLGCVAGVVSPQIAAQWALDLSSSAFLVEPHLLELAGLADYMRLHGVIHHPLDNEIPHIVQAVSALGAAFHLQELSSCVQQQSANGTNDESNSTSEFDCSPAFAADPSRVPSQMLTALRQLSMPATSNSRGPAELEGTSNHFTPSGRLVANRYLIQKLMAGSGESSPVAWFSDDDGLVLAAVMTSQSRFDFFGHASSVPLLTSVPPFVIDERTIDYNINNKVEGTEDPEQEPTGLFLDDVDNLITASPSSRPLFLFVQGRTWAASILAVSATELLATFYILVVLVSRMCDTDRTTSVRLSTTQTMSLLLLLAVMAQLTSVALFVLPGLATHLKLFLPPLFLVTGYALLLAKLFQFRHLASAGLGGSVPQCPLYVAVLLAVSVQVAVSAHFYTQEQHHQSPTSINYSNELPLLYLFLMVLVTVTALYASSLRQIRQQHREAQLILIGTLTSAVLMLGWTLVVTMADEEYHDAATAGLMVLLAASVLGSIFIPRVVQLSRQGRQLSIKSTYACNISMASGIPTSPWLDYNFTSAKDQQTYNANNCNSSNCTNGYNSYKSQSGDNSKNLTNVIKLSGSGLMRHPQYSGRH
ncbi:uncharacterized protein LOC130695215 [Daphnia carinata]|uniref:uncharacterized protein LOC130695215 n=1 Tax=Daphnia carinata TaxID=120202 RepID=UPI00257CBF7E|nr:uncharacterized protein LOC130695215 [Daphnia carinata]XP_057374319.1 uncharacterized protein LOC130695215 [Daphnia carinata]